MRRYLICTSIICPEIAFLTAEVFARISNILVVLAGLKSILYSVDMIITETDREYYVVLPEVEINFGAMAMGAEIKYRTAIRKDYIINVIT